MNLPTQLLDDKQRYFNRDRSLLRFNLRVLEEAEDQENPLLERVKFLAIVSSNLDEFCMVRLAELMATKGDSGEDQSGLSVQQQFDYARSDLKELVARQYACWNDEVRPALQEELGVEIVGPADWTKSDRTSLSLFYTQNIEPILTPIGVDAGHPFPLLGNQRINIAYSLQSDENPKEERRAFVAVPQSKRVVSLPGSDKRVALLEDVVEQFADSLFPGYSVKERTQIRITRDGSLEIDEQGVTDLLEEIERELHNRSQGHAIRCEVKSDAPAELLKWILESLGLDEESKFSIPGPLDMRFFFGIAGRFEHKDHIFQDHTPLPCPVSWADPFARIREQELFLHHPYQSFDPVVELVQKAAKDDRVQAIKMTLYRVSADSPIIRALELAAKNGKEVTVLVELKARFDEEANIRWARHLEESGAHVIYGVLGLKVHAKLLLIIRRDEDGIRRYCHLGTGNYNDKTARLYTDFSYMTCNEAIGRDVSALFNVLTGFAQPPHWERLAVAPTTMRRDFVAWTRREAEHARQGRPALIRARFNSLFDVGICEELYKASQAGVKIELIVRGICILRPGVPGLSENIEVHSIIGRFLEHSRYYYFLNDGGSPVHAIASADWMSRNLDRRVESLTTITNEDITKRLEDLFIASFADKQQTRVLEQDGNYRRLKVAASSDKGIQLQLMDEAKRQGAKPGRNRRGRIVG